MKYNVYCDESGHLKNDASSVMILGAISCPEEQKKRFLMTSEQLKEAWIRYLI